MLPSQTGSHVSSSIVGVCKVELEKKSIKPPNKTPVNMFPVHMKQETFPPSHVLPGILETFQTCGNLARPEIPGSSGSATVYASGLLSR